MERNEYTLIYELMDVVNRSIEDSIDVHIAKQSNEETLLNDRVFFCDILSKFDDFLRIVSVSCSKIMHND